MDDVEQREAQERSRLRRAKREKCAGCLKWEPGEGGRGRCMHFPPGPAGEAVRTHDYEWCGQWVGVKG